MNLNHVFFRDFTNKLANAFFKLFEMSIQFIYHHKGVSVIDAKFFLQDQTQFIQWFVVKSY